jgi:hypothetical protein
MKNIPVFNVLSICLIVLNGDGYLQESTERCSNVVSLSSMTRFTVLQKYFYRSFGFLYFALPAVVCAGSRSTPLFDT